MADWLIEPRNPAGATSLRPLRHWSDLQVTDRYLNPGPFSIGGPTKDLLSLMAPGMGVVLSRSGVQVMSGTVTDWSFGGDGNGVVTGWDDKVWLGGGVSDDKGRIIFPNYLLPITSQQVGSVTLTGVREDLIVNLINQHAGPSALVSRRVPRLAVPASLHRGGTTTITVQLDLLHKVIATLAEQAGLNVRVVHDESTGTPRLLVVITAVQDVSARVRFGPADQGGPGVLGSDWSLKVSSPSMTDAVVGGTKPLPANANTDDTSAVQDNSGVDLRQYRVVSDVSSTAAAWIRRAEGFVDSSATNTAAELDQAGRDALNEATERREFSGTLTDNRTIRYGRDWFIGYKVGVTAGHAEFADIVREVVTAVKVQQGQQVEQVQAAVGWSKAAVVGTAAALPSNRLALGFLAYTYKQKVL